MSSAAFPEPPAQLPATSTEGLEEMIARVADRADDWKKVGLDERIRFLDKIIDGLNQVAPQLVADGCKAKGIPADSPLAGEEWLATVTTTVRNARLFRDALRAGGQPKLPGTHTRADGQIVADVFPTDLQDKLMFTGLRAEVWITPGKTATQGMVYREPGSKKGGGFIYILLSSYALRLRHHDSRSS